MKLISRDDIIESIVFFRLIGFRKILSKLHLNPAKRTANKFEDGNNQSVNTNWWSIPVIKDRLNQKITGDKSKSYEYYINDQYFQKRNPRKMLSMGSGVCSHELIFAQTNPNLSVCCVDISESSLNIGRKKAIELGLNNIEFICADVNTWQNNTESYDIVLFHSSLHHFKHISKLLDQVEKCLSKSGLIIIYEFVGPKRLNWTKHQLSAANNFLLSIPEKWRTYPMKRMTKRKITGPGLLRMLLMDPSEAVESHLIRQEMKSRFNILEEKNLGGNLLTIIFKGIAHHFSNLDNPEKSKIVQDAFSLEDSFIEKNLSDLMFGVYERKP